MRNSLHIETANENKQFKETETFKANSYLIRKAFDGTVFNRALFLHGGFLEITRTVPLILDQLHEQFPVFFVIYPIYI